MVSWGCFCWIRPINYLLWGSIVVGLDVGKNPISLDLSFISSWGLSDLEILGSGVTSGKGVAARVTGDYRRL